MAIFDDYREENPRKSGSFLSRRPRCWAASHQRRCNPDYAAQIVDKRWGNLSTISFGTLPFSALLHNALFRARKIFGGNRFHHFFHMALNTEKGARGVHRPWTLPLRLDTNELPHCFPLTLKIALRLNHIFPLLLLLVSNCKLTFLARIHRSTRARSVVYPTTVYILCANVREWQADLGKGM